VKLTDLLMEVASWTGFDKQFLHASTLHPPKEEEKPAIMAAIMAMGTNIGLTKIWQKQHKEFLTGKCPQPHSGVYIKMP
jgi:hypothetical protein